MGIAKAKNLQETSGHIFLLARTAAASLKLILAKATITNLIGWTVLTMLTSLRLGRSDLLPKNKLDMSTAEISLKEVVGVGLDSLEARK